MTYVRYFSPGPWKVWSDMHDTWIENRNHSICVLSSLGDQPVAANARLLVLVPTMVDLLRDAWVQLDKCSAENEEAQKVCKKIGQVIDEIYYDRDQENKNE